MFRSTPKVVAVLRSSLSLCHGTIWNRDSLRSRNYSRNFREGKWKAVRFVLQQVIIDENAAPFNMVNWCFEEWNDEVTLWSALSKTPTGICRRKLICSIARESRQTTTLIAKAKESVSEVRYVVYMPGVYKMLMVRMFQRGLTNLRMYRSISLWHRNVSLPIER